jgi:peptidase E
MSQIILLLSSSSFLEKDFQPILGRPLKEYKLAHITTAGKGEGVRNLDYQERTRNRLRAQECVFEDIDIDGKNEDELREIFKNFDGVFMNGGSTFYLLKSIRESGFETVIKELLPQGFLYMGASAGAYVACPTIEMSLWPHQDKYSHYGMEEVKGMHLVPFLVTVHYTPEHEVLLKEKIPTASLPVHILTDEQAIIVRDGVIEFLGEEKIKIGEGN